MFQLFDGDATFVRSFTKVMYGESGSSASASFKADKGKKFVVMLLGEVDANATDADLEAMLGKLGFVRAEK